MTAIPLLVLSCLLITCIGSALLPAANDDDKQLDVAPLVDFIKESSDYGVLIASECHLDDLGSLSLVSRCFLGSIEQALIKRYYDEKGILKWSGLLVGVRTANDSQRRALIRFLLHHWPKSDDKITSGLLIDALRLFKQLLMVKKYEPLPFPYIPGQYRLYQALHQCGAIACGQFPPEAFFHEDTEVIADCSKSPFMNMAWVSQSVNGILSSGNEKAIRNLTFLFPKTRIENNAEYPIMSWAGLSTGPNILLAIHFHKATYKEALMTHISKFIAEDELKTYRIDIVHLLMSSSLSTADILILVGGKITDSSMFYYPDRLMDMLRLRGYKGIKIDFDILAHEKFRGPYSGELRKMDEWDFNIICVLAGADDDRIMEAMDCFPRENAEFFIYPIMLAKRDVKLLGTLVDRLDDCRRPTFGPRSFKIPVEYFKCLFNFYYFAMTIMDRLIFFPDLDTDHLHLGIRLLSPEFLSMILENYKKIKGDLAGVLFYDGLIAHWETDKRAVIENYLSNSDDSSPLHIALVAQDLEKLEQIFYEIDNEGLKAKISKAIEIKLAQQNINTVH